MGGDFVTKSGAGANDSRTVLEAAAIQKMLDNGESTIVLPDGKQMPYRRLKHPYRFVFLDGCQTANGLAWPKAFGMDLTRKSDLSSYQCNVLPGSVGTLFLRPNVFLGWKEDVWLDAIPVKDAWIANAKLGHFCPQYNLFHETLMNNWATGNVGISDAIEIARQAVVNSVDTVNWAGNNIPNLEILGYDKLRFHRFNQDFSLGTTEAGDLPPD
jgi:hypothetical protein